MNAALADRAAAIQLLTFDCYGTLIDWRRGIREALEPALAAAGAPWTEAAFERYVDAEAQLEARAYRPYREILDAAAGAVLAYAGAPAEAGILSGSLCRWPAFPDTAAALRRLAGRFRLGVLSNVDRDLFAQTAVQLGVRMDLLVTAQDVRSYKPAPVHFQHMLQVSGLGPGQVLHVAQSLHHDIIPCTELGLACVWINRYGEARRGPAQPLAEFPDLAALADDLLGPA